jgi:hypothetical protein
MSHGGAGRFTLGNDRITKSTLDETKDEWRRLGKVLADGASINLFGCNLIAGDGEGKVLINRLSKVVGATVFASTDLTGRGGDWVLEATSRNDRGVRSGVAASPHPFSVKKLTRWAGSLATSLGSETLVNTTTNNLQRTHEGAQAVATDANGNFVIVWSGNGTGDADGIFAQRYNALGVPQGSEFRVNTTTTGVQTSPAVAMDADGDFVIVWSGEGAGDTAGIFGQRFNAAGVAQGAEFRANTTLPNVQTHPSVGMSDAGSFVISWTSANQDGAAGGIYARRYNAAGAPQGVEFQVNFVTTANDQDYSRVAMDADGDFVIVWASVINAFFQWGIAGQRFTAGGAAVTTDGASEFIINTTIADDQHFPAVAMSPGGAFVVTWQSNLQDGSGLGVYARQYSEAGSPGAEFRVNGTTANAQQYPSIGMDDAGNFTITWQSNLQDTATSWGIYARDYTAAGVARGAEYLVNTTTALNQQYGSIAMDSNGDFVVVWSGNGAGDADGVFMQRYRSPSGGITITQAPNLTTTEGQGTATFTVQLAHQPTSNVTLTFSSSATDEGTVTSGVTFTPLDWNVAQVVTITGVNDDIDDGNVGYRISTLASSADAAYHDLAAADVSVTNTDDDTAGVTVSLLYGPTTEAGGTARFTVVLTSEPLQPVTISLASSNTGEGTLSAGSVTFTSLDWNVPQSVDVSGVDDARDDGDVNYTINTGTAGSADPTYNGMDVANVSLSNTDDDTAGIVVSPTSGLVTTEGGGAATFTVVLTSQPAFDVTINLSSSDTTEGTLDRSSVTFTPASWDEAQTVTVTGVNDDFDDGDATGNPAYSVITAAAVSGDGQYGGMNAADVALSNTDDDVAGFTIEWLTPQVTTESGGTAQFRIRLNAEPTSAVVISIDTSDGTEGSATPNNYSLNSSNWNQWRTITVTGLDDALIDGDIGYVLHVSASSSDTRYDGLQRDLDVTNLDDDTPGITVTQATTPLVVNESGGSGTFEIRLNSQPTQDVVIDLVLGDGTEGTLSAASLLFTPGNWETPQVVTVAGLDDDVDDGNVDFTITVAPARSADSNYDGLDAADVSVRNLDDDAAGILVTAISGPTTESGGVATYTVVLQSQPLADVFVSVVSSDSTEGQVLTTLHFTPGNWDTPQIVTVTGVDDSINDGDIDFVAVNQPAQSADPGYDGLNASNVTVRNLDNDAGRVLVSLTTAAYTTEAGGTARLRIVLDSRPTENVIIQLFSSDESEGVLGGMLLTFTVDNWDTPQFVDVTGVDDGVADGDAAYTIGFTTSSLDPDFDGLSVADVPLTNREAVDTTPSIATSAGTRAVTENDAPRRIDAGLVVADIDGVLSGAAVRITAGYVRGEDLLAFTSANGISGAWNAATGTLTLSGSATVAQYQDALRSVTYENTSDDPSAAPRTVRFTVTDGDASDSDTKALAVEAVNDAPRGVAERYAASADSNLVVSSSDGVLRNDSDPDDSDGTLSAVLVTAPTLGDLTLNPDGSFTYVPTSRTGGADRFVYRTTDDQDAGEPVTVTITVDPVEEGPDVPTDPPPPPPPSPPVDEEAVDPEPPEKPDRPKPAPRPTPRPEKPDVSGPVNPVPPSERPAAPPARVQLPSVTRERQDVTFTRAITIEAATTDFGYQPIPVEATPGNSELPVIEIPALPKWEITETLTQSLDQLADQLTAETQTANTAAAVVGSAALVWVGYVVYSLRGGALLLTFLTSMPLWRTLDPLPVLEASEARAARRKNKKKRDGDDQEDPDERNLRSVLG